LPPELLRLLRLWIAKVAARNGISMSILGGFLGGAAGNAVLASASAVAQLP